MNDSDAKKKLEEFRAWLRKVEGDPEPERARAMEMREFAGEIFDDGFLDGQQYHAIYELTAALKKGEDVEQAVATALRMI